LGWESIAGGVKYFTELGRAEWFLIFDELVGERPFPVRIRARHLRTLLMRKGIAVPSRGCLIRHILPILREWAAERGVELRVALKILGRRGRNQMLDIVVVPKSRVRVSCGARASSANRIPPA